MNNALKELDNTLKIGKGSLNWNSLGIPDFIDQCKEALTNFKQDKEQVEKNIRSIQQSVTKISEATLVKEFDWNKKDLMDLNEF